MSAFSEYLKQYLEEKEITAAELAQEMKMDRSTVFRYTTGTRAPSDIDIVRKIANALQMQNSDKIRLLGEYDRATLGEKTVNSYQYVRKLLGNLKNVTEEISPDAGKWKQAAALPGAEGNICLESRKEIEMCATALFEAAKQENKEVYLLVQPVYREIQEQVQRVFQGSSVKVEQIICLEQDFRKSHENLDALGLVLPLGFTDIVYEVRYYYDSISSHFNEMCWMPNVILAESQALLFDYKMLRGVFFQEENIVSVFRKQYGAIRERTEKLMAKLDGVDEALKFYVEIEGKVFDEENSTMLETLGFQPCVGLCICSNIYEECVYPFQGKDAFIQAMARERGDWDGLKRVRERMGREIQTTSYFQMEGLKEFMETGIVREFPLRLYRPLPMEKRKLVLGRILCQIEEGDSVYRILPENIEIPENIFFYLSDEKIFFMRVMPITKSGFVQVQVLEKGIYSAFRRFVEYLEQRKLLRSSEESLEMLRGFAKEYGVL